MFTYRMTLTSLTLSHRVVQKVGPRHSPSHETTFLGKWGTRRRRPVTSLSYCACIIILLLLLYCCSHYYYYYYLLSHYDDASQNENVTNLLNARICISSVGDRKPLFRICFHVMFGYVEIIIYT